MAVHPFASVEARTWPAHAAHGAVVALAESGERVVVTGGAEDREAGAEAAGDVAHDLTGRTSYAELAAVFAAATVTVAVNTGPAHLSAAIGTPVVSLFAPTVPWERWHPYGVPVRRLGRQDVGCAGTRARRCPISGHPCLTDVAPADVVSAVRTLKEAVA